MNYKKAYDTIYNRGYRKKKNNINFNKIDWILERYSFNSILDVGCSYGEYVNYFQNKGKDAHGIDIAEKPIKESMAEKNCKEGSILDIPFTNNRFEALICMDVLEHIDSKDLKKAIDELYRVTSDYFFIKISTRLERQRQWASILNIPNIHLTVKPIDRWIILFLENRNLFLREIKYNFLIFKKG